MRPQKDFLWVCIWYKEKNKNLEFKPFMYPHLQFEVKKTITNF